MLISNDVLLNNFHQEYGVVIYSLQLQNSELLKQIECMIISPKPEGVCKSTKLRTIKLLFYILDILSIESVKILRTSGVSFLLEDTEEWVRFEYLIHASNPKKEKMLIKAFSNAINYSHNIYQTQKIITTTALIGNEYQLRLYCQAIFHFELWGTQLLLDLRFITSSYHKVYGKTAQTTLTSSLKGFFDILPVLNIEQLGALKASGLRSLLSNKENWIQLEFSIHNSEKSESAKILTKQLQNLINYSITVFEQSKHISTTKHYGMETSLLQDAYLTSIELFIALVDWKVKQLNDGVKENSIRHNLIGVINAMKYLRISETHKSEFARRGLSLLHENIELSEELRRNIVQLNNVVMVDVFTRLGLNYPDYRVQIKSRRTEAFLKNTYKYSMVIFDELRHFAANQKFNCSNKTVNNYFSSFDSIGLPLLKDVLTDDEFKELSRLGLSYLNNIVIYEKINLHARHNKIPKKQIGLLILKYFFNEEIPLSRKSPYTIYFSGISRNNESTPFNMDVIGDISEEAFKDFKIKHDKYIKNIDLMEISEMSYYSQLQDFVAGLKKVLPKLSNEQIRAIKNYGLSAFVDSKYKISITCLEKFQSLVKSKRENSKTIKGYRAAFRNILQKFVGEVPDIYVISTRKDNKIKSLSFDSDKYYTLGEIKELTFYIEKALTVGDISLENKILLYYARIQIKSGWNQQPLLDLSLDRLVKRINPVTNQENYDLVLVKNRRSYKPSKYDFNENAIKDKDLRSVIRDIIFVKNNLTSELRVMNYLDNYLFILPCEVNGAKRLDVKYLKKIPTLISDLGCEVHYNPSKIRKGGVNFIYKNIAKNIREYEGMADHSYQTFILHYQEVLQVESVDKISDGIDIMAKYFSGKEISQELHAVDEAKGLQETPSGACSSGPDSDEVERYNKLNAKVIDENNKFCGDFLSCIWCKYFKVVKDADHIWKLLSYKEYVVSTMERSIVNNEEQGGQKEFIDILSKRVDHIVSFIEETKPEVVKKGKFLISAKGLHPDWEFAFPLLNVVGNDHE